MGYIEDRQSNARKSYAQRMREEEERRRKEEEERRRKEEEERRRREEARHRAEEERRKREEAQQKAEEEQKAAQQRADDHRRQMERQKQQQTKPAQAAPDKTAPKSANTFYTNQKHSDIMQPRFNSISAYENEISKHQEALKALNKQQFNLMLKNDVTGMDALDAPIKQAEEDIDNLKLEMYEVMGAYERGRKGNQLLQDDKWGGFEPKEDKVTPNMGDMSLAGNDKPGLNMTNGKPLFAANDTAAHVTGLDDGADSFFGYRPESYEEETDAYFGKRPKDYEDEKSGSNSGGGFGGGGAGGSWGEKPSNEVPDYIKQSYSGDTDSIEYIKSSGTFKDVVNMLAMYGQYEESESKLALQITETDEVDVSEEVARTQYNELINQKNTDVNVGLGAYSLMLGSSLGGGLFEISATAAFLIDAGLFLGDIALPEYSVNEDIEDELGGVYKISRFTLDADWDIKGYGGGTHVTRTGYVIYGEPIVLDNGNVYSNPLNAVFFDVISE